MDKVYDAKKVEDAIYQKWEASGFFNPDNLSGEPYAIMMPPPNVTGILHLGHALENALMDTMARYQRMRGKKVLLLPGTDHAAIATQAKVEKLLMEKGIKNPRQDLGREKLLQEIREYAEKSKSTILGQVKKLGTSCDWSRLAYTFDEPRSRAVNEIFFRMYQDGLVYRGYRTVNWSLKGQSTCSDDELIYIERPGKLYTFKYSEDFPISIATTRPETKLGDTAVAVNPKDKRYKKYIGQIFEVKNFADSVDLKIKIIADPHVEMEFGTGALGVTPAHSSVDFEMYERQHASGDDIGLVQVIDRLGQMTHATGEDYEGMTTEDARAKIVEWLEKKGLLEGTEEIVQSVGTSDRFGDVVEVIPMEQWWLDVNKKIPGRKKSLKELIKQAVVKGHKGDRAQKINIQPKNFEKVILDWVDNLRDWCISRQIWWGHQIPVWYKDEEVYVGIEAPDVRILKKEFPPLADKEVDDRTKRAIDILKKFATRALEKKWQYVVLSGLAIDAHLGYVSRNHKDLDLLVDRNDVQAVKSFLEQEGHAIYESKKYGSDLLRVDPIDAETTRAAHCDIHISFLDDQTKEVVVPMLGKEMRFAGGYDDITTNKEFLGVSIKVLSVNLLLEEKKGWEEKIGLSGRDERNNLENKKIQRIIDVVSGWQQDPDTLDTWFSSGMWAFSTLLNKDFEKYSTWNEWVKNSPDLKTFHPTSWMQMGYEIKFLWLVRMILMSTYALDQIPFHDVYMHGMLRDQKGEKFSKSKGNNIDPLEMIEKYGTDALRFSVISGITPGNDSRFYLEKIEGSRNFVNKLWNISRYILSQPAEKSGRKSLTLADKWILEHLEATIYMVSRCLENYDFSSAIEIPSGLREFMWNKLADWYLEVSKVEGENSDVSIKVLETLLKLLHPFMPFVTEQIWQEMGHKNLLMVEKWPVRKNYNELSQVNIDFDLIQRIISEIRNWRSENKIEPKEKINATVFARKMVVEDYSEVIKKLGRLENLVINIKPTKEDLYDYEIKFDREIDAKKEKTKVAAEIVELEKYLAGLAARLNNQEFAANAPKEIVAKEEQRLAEAQEKLVKLQERQKSLE